MFPLNDENNRPRSPRTPDGDPPPRRPQNPLLRYWWVVVAIILLVLTIFRVPEGLRAISPDQPLEVDYSFFYDQLVAGNVREVVIQQDTAQGAFVNPVTYPPEGSPLLDRGLTPRTSANFRATLLPVNDPDLPGILRENTQLVIGETPTTNPLLVLLLNFGLLLLIGLLVWQGRRAQRQMGGVFGFGRTQAREYDPDRPQVKFTDVAGQEAAKGELVEIVDFLREPDKYIALGARIPRGVLLVGPPGTGKTLLARAVAGEAGVSFFSIAASEFVEMFVGVGASRVRDLFGKAKSNAPAIVFIDEIDAVGRQRGAGLGGGNDEREQTLNQMLAEMDGFDQTESVIVMAATNRPDVLDPALLRPGRFDRQVTVALPDRPGREDILRVHVRGKPLAEEVDLPSLSRATIGFSGADLANLTNEAALAAARANRKRVLQRDFLEALDRILLGTKAPPLSNDQERRVVAYHEAGHALVSTLTPGADPVVKVTIIPRGQALGVTAMMPEDDRRNYSKAYLESQLLVLLGGRAAEEVAIGEVTTGASSDLQRVTNLARRMVSQFGMSDAIGPINYGEDERQPFLGYSIGQGRSYSEETAARIDVEVRRLVEDAHERTVALIRENRDKLDQLAEELLTNEVVDRVTVERIAGVRKPDEANRVITEEEAVQEAEAEKV